MKNDNNRLVSRNEKTQNNTNSSEGAFNKLLGAGVATSEANQTLNFITFES
jgi:hypothetical protein